MNAAAARDWNAELAAQYPRMLGLARRHAPTPEDAEDLVQTAMLNAYRARHTFEGRSTVSTWLCRIVMNAIRDQSRRPYERRRQFCEMPEGSDPSASPLDLLLRAERSAILEARLELLPGKLRKRMQVLVLHASTRAAAEATGQPENTFKVALHRAQKLIREEQHAAA